jgi:hypothetical protein
MIPVDTPPSNVGPIMPRSMRFPAVADAIAETSAGADRPQWRLVLRALAEMGGFERGVLYDVPRAEAPRVASTSGAYVRSTSAWRRFLRNRARLDDGPLTLMLALRRLDDAERRLAVDWGCRHANSFVLVEPLDQVCDLTDPSNAVRRTLDSIADQLLNRHNADFRLAEPWTRSTALGTAVRSAFGTWIAWREPHSELPPDEIVLRLDHPESTLKGRLLEQLITRYPQASFDAALEDLYERERELFGGPVARARMPFRTRLGLPVLYDVRRVDDALRRLVNKGEAWLFEDGPDPAVYHGHGHPVPERMTDAEFEQLLVR